MHYHILIIIRNTESFLIAAPLIQSAVVFGRGRAQIGVNIEPAKYPEANLSDVEGITRFRNAMWCVISWLHRFKFIN